MEANRTRGPNCGVSRTLLVPKFPRPARYAAWRCEKNETGFSFSTLTEPYPSRGIQTDGYPSAVRADAIRYPSSSSRVLTVRVQFVVPDRRSGLEDRKADRKADHNNGLCFRPYRSRPELLRHPWLEGGVIPAICRCKPHQGDVHAKTALPDLLYECGRHSIYHMV